MKTVRQNPKAVVLCSGGMDSCVTAVIAAQTHDVYLLHAQYGQRTAERERQAFEDVARHLGAVTRIIDLRYLADMGASITNPQAQVEVFDPTHVGAGIPSTYLPFRNGNLLAAAVSWAEALGATDIFLGAVNADSSGYPDCRPEFLEAFEAAANLGTRPDTRIHIRAPLVEMTKAQIVTRGLELKAPLELTWSCYIGREVACGTCESCGLRLRGFEEAGVSDPIPYLKVAS